ncbi:MAG TPA: 5'-nucleotidase C-terminal domain-containing protein [Actinopolymorphaceae bacterium]
MTRLRRSIRPIRTAVTAGTVFLTALLVQLTILVPPAAPAVDAASTDPRRDDLTRGDWRGVYGSAGYVVVGDPDVHLPGGVTVDMGGTAFVWDAAASDERALQRPSGTGRLAAARYGTTFDIVVDIPAGSPGFRLAIYVLDYDTDNTRGQLMTLRTPSGEVLGTADVRRFRGGRYLLWDIPGSVRLTVERTAGANAVVSGLFLDPLGTPDPPGDTTPPTVEATAVGSRTSSGEYVGWARVTLAADDGDGAGVDTIEYAVGDGAWEKYVRPVWFRNPGEHVLRVRATDLAGNPSEPATVTVHVVPGEPDLVPLRVIGLNDYHGADANGPRMATAIKELRAEQPNNVLLGVGDLIGWTTYANDATRDEFVIDLLEYLGMDAHGAGNHEFDEGIGELLRIQRGGCHPVDGCFDHDGDGVVEEGEYDGSDVPILVANLVHERTGERVFPGSLVRTVDGVRIGVVAATTESTARGIGVELFPHHEFLDPVVAINREVRKLRARGVQVIVALVHEGGLGAPPSCLEPAGPMVDIATRTDAEVDLILGGHWHTTHTCVLRDPAGRPRPVLEASPYGAQLQLADLVVSRRGGDVLREHSVGALSDIPATLPPDPGAQAIIARATQIANARGEQIVGRVVGDFRRGRNAAGQLDPSQQSTLLNLHADAELAWVREHVPGSADFALADHVLVNGDLLHARSGNEPEDGLVRWRETWSANIYDARMLVLTMTGAEIERVLRSQWDQNLLMGVSHNVWYLRDPSETRIPGRMSADLFYLDGEPLERKRTYRVVVNSIIARGFDWMPAFASITQRYDTGVPVRTAHNWYLGAHSPLDPRDYAGRIPTIAEACDRPSPDPRCPSAEGEGR